MREYNERVLKNVLEDIREEQDKEFLKEIEEAANDPRFQLKEGEAEAFVKKYVPKKKKNTQKILFRVASVLLVLAIGIVVIPIPVQGQKSTVAELIANFVNSEFVAIGNEDLLLTYEGEYIPTWIPEGYEVDSVTNTKDSKTVILINANKKSIIYSEKANNSNTNIDFENNGNIKNIEILGYKSVYIEKDGKQQIAITTTNSVIHIFCNDTDIDLIGFAEHIEKR